MPSRKNRASCASRKNQRRNRRNTRRNRRGGSYASEPAPFSGNSMAGMQAQSLQQGQQFASYHDKQHGGGSILAGPYPGAVGEESMLPAGLHASARVAPLDAAIREIQGLKDQSGGRRGRKASKKSRKASKKSRKASKKSRKASKKSRKVRRNRRGGAYSLENASPFSAPGLLLSSDMESKALSGMNSEWKLASDPKAFAPGV